MRANELKRILRDIIEPPKRPEFVYDSYATPSLAMRFRRAIQPPPPAIRAGNEETAMRRRRRISRCIAASAMLAALAFASFRTHAYVISAPLRTAMAIQDASRLMATGDYVAALAPLNRAAKISPANADIYFKRGLLRKLIGDKGDARQDLQHALSLAPNLVEAHVVLGSLFGESGDYPEAMHELDLSIALQPSLEALCARGELHRSLGQNAEAVQDFSAAILLMPNAPAAYRARALALAAEGSVALAKADRQRASDLEHNITIQ
jgi:tetratricopeptide (TPR) repeat protein